MNIHFGYALFSHASLTKNLSSSDAWDFFTRTLHYAQQSKTSLVCMQSDSIDALLNRPLTLHQYISLGYLIQIHRLRLFIYASSSCSQRQLLCYSQFLERMGLDTTHKIICSSPSSLSDVLLIKKRVCMRSPFFYSTDIPILYDWHGQGRIDWKFLKTWMKKDGRPSIMCTSPSQGIYKKRYHSWIYAHTLEQWCAKVQDKELDIILYAEEKKQTRKLLRNDF